MSSSRRASRVGRDTKALWRSVFSLVCQAHLCFRAHDRYQMVSDYNVPYTLDGDPVWLSLAGSAWWRRREIRTGTRDEAVVRPVSIPSSRTETWGKLPGSRARPCARFSYSPTTISFQNVKCDVHNRKKLRATVALSGAYDIGVKIDGSFEGWVIEFFQLNCRSSPYTVFFGVPGDNSPGTEARTLLADLIALCLTQRLRERSFPQRNETLSPLGDASECTRTVLTS